MKLILIDRDGVINIDSPDYIKSPEEWHPIVGSLEAIAALKKADWHIGVVTNQSGLARGYFDRDTLDAMHNKMCEAIQKLGGDIDAIFICPHHPDDNCHCRKPNPGLLEQAKQHFQCDLHNVPFIGDSWKDIEAATAAGAQPILVLTGNGKSSEQKAKENGIAVFNDLNAVAIHLLRID